MSVQTSSGGSAGDKHFIDTGEAWTSTGTEDPHLSVTIFQQDTNNMVVILSSSLPQITPFVF